MCVHSPRCRPSKSFDEMTTDEQYCLCQSLWGFFAIWDPTHAIDPQSSSWFDQFAKQPIQSWIRSSLSQLMQTQEGVPCWGPMACGVSWYFTRICPKFTGAISVTNQNCQTMHLLVQNKDQCLFGDLRHYHWVGSRKGIVHQKCVRITFIMKIMHNFVHIWFAFSAWPQPTLNSKRILFLQMGPRSQKNSKTSSFPGERLLCEGVTSANRFCFPFKTQLNMGNRWREIGPKCLFVWAMGMGLSWGWFVGERLEKVSKLLYCQFVVPPLVVGAVSYFFPASKVGRLWCQK